MNHADVRERMELAALEPEGLDRLMAGDTLDAAAVATHLAGCPACLEELGRLRRTAELVRRGLLGGELARLVPSEAPMRARPSSRSPSCRRASASGPSRTSASSG